MSKLELLRRITASALDRVIKCPGSEALPHIRRNSEDAKAGTWRHWYLENIEDLGEDKALAGVPEKYREMCEAIDLEGLPVGLASEVAFAYNWRTGEARELGRGLHRNYSMCGPDEIPGTIDAVGVSADLLYVGDYKGWALVKARDNAQLLFAALCGTKVFHLASAEMEIINVQGSINWRSKTKVDIFDLGSFADKLKTTMLKVIDLQSGKLELEAHISEGDHCRYCPAYDSCPAKTKMLLVMAGGESLPTLNKETARSAYQTFRAMQKLTAIAGARIHAYAEHSPIDLGDGLFYGPHSTEGNESIDGDAAYELIRKRLGQTYADKAVTHKATKSGIQLAVRKAKKDAVISGTQKAEFESLLIELRASGAATRKPSTKTEEHRPAPASLKA